MALFKDLDATMRADQLFTDTTKIEANACANEWKNSVGGLWRHPLWAGKCVHWGRPAKKNKQYNVIDKLLGHTVGAQETVADDFVLKQAEAYMAAQSMQDPTWQTKMCIPNKKDPTKCTFSSSIGDPPVPITNEMGINRGLLLASRFGISRNNAKLCSCDCCFVKDSKSVKREDKIAGDVCRKHTIGVVSGSWLVVGWSLVGGFVGWLVVLVVACCVLEPNN